MIAPGKSDRRVERTRNLLRDALLALMVERGYENITVQQILDRAGVGRATFYAHFRHKEELLKSTLEKMRFGLATHWRQALAEGAYAPGRLGFVLPFLTHLDSRRQLYRAIVGRESGTIVEREMRRMFVDLVRKDIAVHRRVPQGPALDAVVQHIVGGLMSLVHWWMSQKVRLSPEEINRVFLQLTLPGLEAGITDGGMKSGAERGT